MLAWIGKLLASGLIKTEIEKLKNELLGQIKEQISQAEIKHQIYLYADGVLAEGQSKSKEQLDAWFVQKRAEIKTYFGEA